MEQEGAGFVAAIANYLIATVWYAVLFGRMWQKLAGITDMKPKPMNVVLPFLNMGGFFGRLGYIVPVTLSGKLYERKPWGLWLPGAGTPQSHRATAPSGLNSTRPPRSA